MHHRTRTIIATVSVAAVTLIASDAMTYAGTGDSLLLGKLNKAGRTTHVTNTGSGPALSLHAAGDKPALAVDSNARVVKLNADTVDGKHASGLENNVRVYTATTGNSAAGGINFQLPNLPKGSYQATYSVVMAASGGTVANPTAGDCYFHPPGTAVFPAYTSSTSVGHNIGLSASDVINQDDETLLLQCVATRSDGELVDWYIAPGQPVRVTLTRIDKTIGGELTAAGISPGTRQPAH